jgi:hypothetical protein
MFAVTTAINTVAWQKYVAADFYDCVDEAIPGYWEPGFWVHAHDGQSVKTVLRIIHSPSIANPDTIKQGWTVPRLLALWFAFFTVSVVVSLALARIPWTPRKRSNQSLEPTADRR